MKWKLAIILCSYIIGGAFIAAWYVEAQRLLQNPNRNVNLNQIMWMMEVGVLFIFVGSSVVTNILVSSVVDFFRRPSLEQDGD